MLQQAFDGSSGYFPHVPEDRGTRRAERADEPPIEFWARCVAASEGRRLGALLTARTEGVELKDTVHEVLGAMRRLTAEQRRSVAHRVFGD